MTGKPKPKPKKRMTNQEAVEALDNVVDKLTGRALELCDPDNWPQVELEDPDSPSPAERVQQLAINSACAKQAGIIAKLAQSMSNIAENRRRQLTANNLNKPDRNPETADAIADAERRAAAQVAAATAAPVRKVH